MQDYDITHYYEINESIGIGNFGEVHAAKHLATNVVCAIKIIDKTALSQREGSQIYFEMLKSEI